MAEHGDGRCVTMSDFEDTLMEFEDRVEAKYMALKEFSINHMKEQSSRLNSFDERLKEVEDKIEKTNLKELDNSTLRTEFEILKSTPSTPVLGIERFRAFHTAEPVGSEYDVCTRPNNSVNCPNKKRMKFGRRSVATKVIEDLKDDELKKVIQKYYAPKLNQAERLFPVQMAFVTYFFEEVRRGEYSARADVISELYLKGRDCGMWRDGWQPENIKGSFKEYLKEQVRTLNKKKMQEKACKDLVDELAE